MQEPLLQPVPDAGQNQAPDQYMPNPWRSRGGCYPRWWVLATFFMACLTVVGILLWNPVLCPRQAGHLPLPICAVATWPGLVQILLLWLLFAALGVLAFMLGVGLIEVPRRERNRVIDVVRAASEFGPLHPLLLIQGAIGLAWIVALWWLDRTPPVVFVLLSILVFVANCSFFQRIPRIVRRYYLMGYGFLSLIGLVLAFLLKHYLQAGIPEGDQPLLASEALLVLLGIWAIFWHPQPEQPFTAQQALDESISQVATPLYALRSMPGMNRLWPNRPIQPDNQQHPPPGAGGGP
jgi:hypothetical protein